METEPPDSHWCRFTLREVMLLILSAGFALAWYRDHLLAAPIRDAVNSAYAGRGRGFRRPEVTFEGTCRGIRFKGAAAADEWWENRRVKIRADDELE